VTLPPPSPRRGSPSLSFFFRRKKKKKWLPIKSVNDPSAGSPTERFYYYSLIFHESSPGKALSSLPFLSHDTRFPGGPTVY